jgi:hypothetical protein
MLRGVKESGQIEEKDLEELVGVVSGLPVAWLIMKLHSLGKPRRSMSTITKRPRRKATKRFACFYTF